jgi:hypothetical protein
VQFGKREVRGVDGLRGVEQAEKFNQRLSENNRLKLDKGGEDGMENGG